ncbi:hypothetical protein [Micavibrio aeruginosavorus]|uniref:hypothetical protein n=1 Tax=Micavibrio aeruginosavorus TaxID=349221 RepID=UPI003F4AC055
MMSRYTLTPNDPATTREQMEHAVATHGHMRVIETTDNNIVIDADGDTVYAFEKRFPDWSVKRGVEVYAEIAPPKLNKKMLERLRDRLTRKPE